MTEQELAAVVVGALQADSWNVYQEVQMHSGGGPVADIVAVREPVVHIVECKTTYSAQVVGQAEEWLRYGAAHCVSIAVPALKIRASKGRQVLDRYLRAQGIGKILVTDDRVSWCTSISPRLQREPYGIDRTRATLTEMHKTYAAAGNPEGRRWTPFQRTVRDLRRIVKDNPGIALTDAIRRLRDHHYASDQSARASLAKWIRAGKVRGLECEGRRCRLYPVEEAA